MTKGRGPELRDVYLSKSFRARELACKCRRPLCDAPPMCPKFMAMLQDLRDCWMKPLIVNSGVRCEHWNKLNGGAPDSQHLLGRAADLHAENEIEAFRLYTLADKIGFGGVGLYPTWVHVDTGPEGRRWRK